MEVADLVHGRFLLAFFGFEQLGFEVGEGSQSFLLLCAYAVLQGGVYSLGFVGQGSKDG